MAPARFQPRATARPNGSAAGSLRYDPGMHITTPKPRVARGAAVRRGAVLATAALVGAAALSACGSSSKPAELNTARVARAIETSILEQRRLHATVTCPAGVPQEKGHVFECVAIVRSTKPPYNVVYRTPFEVTETNSAGYTTYVGK